MEPVVLSVMRGSMSCSDVVEVKYTRAQASGASFSIGLQEGSISTLITVSLCRVDALRRIAARSNFSDSFPCVFSSSSRRCWYAARSFSASAPVGIPWARYTRVLPRAGIFAVVIEGTGRQYGGVTFCTSVRGWTLLRGYITYLAYIKRPAILALRSVIARIRSAELAHDSVTTSELTTAQ